jgi:hypothetical protein
MLFCSTHFRQRPPRTWTVCWKGSAFVFHPSSPKSVDVAVAVAAEVKVVVPVLDERLRERCQYVRTNLWHVAFPPGPSPSTRRSSVARRMTDLVLDIVAGRALNCTSSWTLIVVVEKAALCKDLSWCVGDEGLYPQLPKKRTGNVHLLKLKFKFDT